MEIVGIVAVLLVCLVLVILFYGIAVYNNLARKKAQLLENVSNIGTFQVRRKRVNQDVRRYSGIASKHELKAIKRASTRGR